AALASAVSVNSVSADEPTAPPPVTDGEAARELVLIEDSRDYAAAIAAMFHDGDDDGGFSIRHFTKLGDALQYVPTSDAACILLDLNLPDAKGIEAVGALQAAVPLIPIVVLTGLDDEQLMLQAMHAGAQDYLVKAQADADLITRTIRYAVERAR